MHSAGSKKGARMGTERTKSGARSKKGVERELSIVLGVKLEQERAQRENDV